MYLHLLSFPTIYCCFSCTTNTPGVPCFPGAGGKKEGAKSFSSYCTLYAFLRLGVSTWVGPGCFNPQKHGNPPCIQGVYIELRIFSSSSRAGWNILEVSHFVCVIFVDSRNQMKRVSSFHKEVFRISELAWFFLLVRSEYQGPTGMVSLTWYLEYPGNIAPKTRAVLVSALRIWWLYKSVNLGLSEVLEFSREMFFLNLLMNRIQQTSWSGYRDHVNCSKILYINGTSNDFSLEKGVKRMAVGTLYVSIFGVPVSWCPAFLRAYFDVVGNSKKGSKKTRMSGREL